MKILIALLCTVSSAFAVNARSVIPAGNFQAESHPTDQFKIQASGGVIHWIQSNTWVRYDNLIFDSDPVIQIRIKASAPTATSGTSGGTINVRHNNQLTGPIIATIVIPSTGGFGNYRDFRTGIDPSFIPNTGGNTIFFEFTGGSGAFMNVQEFSFASTSLSWKSDVKAAEFLQESAPDNPSIIDKDTSSLFNITDNSWVDYGSFDFGDGMAYAWIEASASIDSPQGVERKIYFRTGSKDGPIIGSVEVPNTGGLYKPFAMRFSPPVSDVKRLFLTFDGGSGNLFNLGRFRFERLAPDHKPSGTITDRIDRNTPFIAAAGYTHESHPGNDSVIRPWEKHGVGAIAANSWVRYENHMIPAGANRLSVEAFNSRSAAQIQVYIAPNGSTQPPTGNALTTFDIPTTGGSSTARVFTQTINTTASGPQNVFFRFTGGLDFVRFRFEVYTQPIAANSYSKAPGASSGIVDKADDPGVITVENGDWARYDNVDFGENANMISMTAATPNKGGYVEVRLGSPTSTPIARIDVTYTGDFGHYREYHAALVSPVSGLQTLFLKFVKIENQTGNLFNFRNFIITKRAAEPVTPGFQGTLTLYPNVPALEASPYYTYEVKKFDDLVDQQNKHNENNWSGDGDKTFAWFSRCRFGGESYAGGYYDDYLAGWTHTYCNFEMGKDTRIVVKITRTGVNNGFSNPDGAPAGKIFMANVHPAHKVDSCEVVGSSVYVTMSKPALVTVDIDGQMDTRDNPSRSYPETTAGRADARKNGSHAVSIFANPVMSDKPAAPPASIPTSGPILYLEPGGDATDKMNSRTDWTTVYFLPGVHSFSGFDADVNGFEMPKKFESGDEYVPQSRRTFYIPGDAVVYGNFEGDWVQNLKIYGLGTLSGRFIPHNSDWSWDTVANTYQSEDKLLPNGLIKKGGWGWRLYDLSNPGRGYNMFGVNGEMLSFGTMTNCHIEGVTVADPANHAISADHGSGNTRKWIKQISWRANNDMGGIPGVVEDSFFRLADDALYVSDADFRRNTLWFDVNATPFRCSVIKNGQVRPENQAIIQDCDVIYMRSKFGGLGGDGIVAFVEDENWFGVGKHPMNAPYTGTVNNTAQHVIFRNIRVTDPRPERPFLDINLDIDLNLASNANYSGGGVSGIRFENFEMRNPYNGWSQLNGNNLAPISHLYFDGVTIEGKKLTRSLFDQPSMFQVSDLAYNTDFVFRNAPSDVGSGVPGELFELNINSGGPAYTATDGSTFIAGPEGSTYSTTEPISGTADDTLYQSERYGDFFSYSIPVPNGSYEITLMFAEIYHNQANQRVFNVDIEGSRVITNLDVWSRVGKDAAYNEIHVASVSDGQLNIAFGRIVGDAKISAIKIKKFPATYNLAITPPSNGSISSNPTGPVHFEGTDVTLTASPAAGYKFDSWSGDATGSANPVTITMDADKVVTANFSLVKVLLVVGDTAQMTTGSSDLAIRNRLQGLGYDVQSMNDESVTTADATGKSLIITSSTVISSNIGTKFQSVAVPLINWETALQDEYLFTTAAAQGTLSGQTSLNIVYPSHPMAAALPPGPLTVSTAPSGFSWGQPTASAIIIARLNATPDHPCIYAYETGAAMTGGTAAARRVHLFLQGDTFASLNANGRKLFDAAVSWAMNQLRVGTPTGSSSVDFVEWAGFHGLVAGPNDDDDADGRTNYEEYVFGQHPKNGTSVNPISVSSSMSAGEFTYTRRKSSMSGLSYSVWYSTSLDAGSWIKDAGAIEGTPVPNGEMETVPVTLSPSLLSHTSLFIRVRSD